MRQGGSGFFSRKYGAVGKIGGVVLKKIKRGVSLTDKPFPVLSFSECECLVCVCFVYLYHFYPYYMCFKGGT